MNYLLKENIFFCLDILCLNVDSYSGMPLVSYSFTLGQVSTLLALVGSVGVSLVQQQYQIDFIW